MTRTRRVRRVAILGHPGRSGVRRAAARLRDELVRQRCDVRVDERLAVELDIDGDPPAVLARWCEVLVTLGGDGTALTGARALVGQRGALLPVNLGGLGFLTVAESRDLTRATAAALSGKWPVVRRRVVGTTLSRRGRVVRRGHAMNDAVIKGAGGYAAVHLRMAALGHDLGYLLADGLVAASAAGSTAYSLSAGGPVLAPDVEAMVVTPVCAHSLASRSLVLGPEAELEVRVIGSQDQVLLVLDGQDRSPLEPGDEVRVRIARETVRMFQNPTRPFTRALQAKLGWQGSVKRSM